MKKLRTALLIVGFLFGSMAFARSTPRDSMNQHDPTASCSGKVHQVGLNADTTYRPQESIKSENNGQYEATRGESRNRNGYRRD